MHKVRWGVLGVAKIATQKVIPAMQRSSLCQVVGIASRDDRRARQAAQRLGLEKSYGSYEQLLADPQIEAVYNPLPNHLHVPWTIQALQAGKHVLCEKPIGLSAAEAESLRQAAAAHPRLKVMEAFMYRFHVQWQTARRLVREGQIGTLRTIHSFFSYFNEDAQNIRNIADYGGGAMMDIGCYPISLSRFLFEAEPRRVVALVEQDPRFNTDRLASAILDFGNGSSTFTCGTQLTAYQRVNLVGTGGRIELEIPFNAPPDKPCRLWHVTHDGTITGNVRELVLEVCDQYTVQGDLFSRAIRDDGPVPTPLEDAVGNMRAIEAVLRSGRSGQWECP